MPDSDREVTELLGLFRHPPGFPVRDCDPEVGAVLWIAKLLLHSDVPLDCTMGSLMARHRHGLAFAPRLIAALRVLHADWSERLAATTALSILTDAECLVAEEIEQMRRERAGAPLRPGERAQSATRTVLPVKQFRDVGAATVQDAEDAPTIASRIVPTPWPTLSAWLAGGLRPGDVCYVAARPAVGKAQPLDAGVLLASGVWCRMGELKPGDRLASVDGAPNRVVACHPQGVLPVFRVTFGDGRSTRASADHRWTVTSSKWRTARVVTTADLVRLLNTTRYVGRLAVPLADGTFGRDAANLPDGYFVGAFIGNGSSASGSPVLSTADADTLASVARAVAPDHLRPGSGPFEWRIRGTGRKGGNQAKLALRRLGLWGLGSHERFIPPAYFAACRSTRIALLQGLLDTDGWTQGVRQSTVQFCTTSQRLAADVVRLVRSVGGLAFPVRTRIPGFTHRGEHRQGRRAYSLTISHPDRSVLFRCARKRPGARRHAARLVIRSVTPDGTAPCQCITVSHPSALYLTDDYIPTHNSLLIAQWAMHGAQKGAATLMVSREMPVLGIGRRLLAQESRTSLRSLRTGHGVDWQSVAETLHRLYDLPLWLTDAPTTVDEIVQVLPVCGVPLRAVFVDYLQLLQRTARPQRDKRAEVEAVSSSFKQIAMKRQLALVVISSVGRPERGQRPRPPELASLRESGQLEHDADIVLTMHRDPVGEKPEDTLLSLVKSREDVTGVIPLHFDTARLKFRELDRTAAEGEWDD